MARKTKAKALLDRQKAEEYPQVSKKGDGKDKALKVKGIFARCDYVQPHSKSKSSDGRVEKKTSKRPVSVKEKEALKQARKAMRTGETMSEDQRRRAEQDRRTLYIRFKVSSLKVFIRLLT